MNPPTTPEAPSWVQWHAVHLSNLLRVRGRDEDSANTTLSIALVEEMGT